MKIAIVSTTVIPCPPPGYSGLEMVAWLQAKGLAELGHEVLLVAPKGSKAPDKVEIHETTQWEPEANAYSGYWERLLKQDVVIDNSWEKWSYILKMEGKLKTPVLGVLHAPCDTMYGEAPPLPYPCFVAISKDQALHASQVWGVTARVAYNGIDMDFYDCKDLDLVDRYLFLARMSRVKGAHLAIDACRQARRTDLDLVGDDRITGDPGYAQRIHDEAALNRGMAYHGPVGREKTVEFYSTRKALLHMNREFREPFGLAPVEAQACGMPVIAFDNGAMRETVNDRKTGFVVKTLEEVIELLKSDAVSNIKAEDCREWASQFSVQAMVKRYEQLCIEALETGGW